MNGYSVTDMMRAAKEHRDEAKDLLALSDPVAAITAALIGLLEVELAKYAADAWPSADGIDWGGEIVE